MLWNKAVFSSLKYKEKSIDSLLKFIRNGNHFLNRTWKQFNLDMFFGVSNAHFYHLASRKYFQDVCAFANWLSKHSRFFFWKAFL